MLTTAVMATKNAAAVATLGLKMCCKTNRSAVLYQGANEIIALHRKRMIRNNHSRYDQMFQRDITNSWALLPYHVTP